MTAPDPHDLARQARTLAQAHPFTPTASDYVNAVVAEQSSSQPQAEVGTWAGACLTNGYCLRRVEENQAGLVLQPRADAGIGSEALGAEATTVATDLRTGGAPVPFLIDEDQVVGALDHIIASEVGRRLDNLRNQIDKEAAAEIEEFLTFWTVQGYALRVAERATGVIG